MRRTWRALIERTTRHPVTYTSPGLGTVRLSDLHLRFFAGGGHAKRISPGFGGGATGWESLACAGWSRAAANPPRPLPAGGFPPALGIGGYSNYANTAALVRKIPGSVSVPYEGSGHVMYLAGNRCMTGHADRYLAELRFLGPERSAGRRADRRSGAEIRDGGGEDVGEPAHLPGLLLPPVREHGPVTPDACFVEPVEAQQDQPPAGFEPRGDAGKPPPPGPS
ncbi:alpha/beta hydrolase [Planotetraspora kaengkrachanensis]|uniref:Peptidase S33 tripeptidyl aminopeptidase-like C-terminal domain-containing protein n=1 Tax=Planotetraspora kaengkrachanensis TaxID=575193 RepID=A0A8J3M8A7_9ACTN|nr:alpha/beta hydrolase [Planotetraspora kaengkrachanensis]GIG79560.1 hypothetical protein Pka01_26870 [Planotetraspora kaengkrachanensis]